MVRTDDLIARTRTLPSHEAERLLCLVTGRSRTDVLLGFDVDEASEARFAALAARRIGGEPLQYIEGAVPFGPVQISVDDRVLVPRPETEYLFEMVVSKVEAPRVIVDLCTGSGNLALALKATFPGSDVHAADLSAEAVEVAKANAAANGLEVHIRHGDLFDPLPDDLKGSVDLLVANPPYLAIRELAGLPVDVRREPEIALVAGPSGDEVIRAIATQMGAWLRPGGIFGIEVSEFHASEVVDLFDSFEAAVVEDLTGRERFVMGSSHVG